MPTITNAELKAIGSALSTLVEERIPIVGALRIRKLVRALNEHYADVEAERMKLLKLYGTKREDGELELDEHGNVKFGTPENQQAFEADFSALMNETWTCEHGVKASDLGSIEVKTATLLALGDLLEEEKEGDAHAS